MFLKIVAVVLLYASTSDGFPERREGWIGTASDSHVPIDPYIVGGEVVHGREFPSQISLRFEGQHNCGGTILNSQWILTAGHCGLNYDASALEVITGTNCLDEVGKRHKVEEVIVHEKFAPDESFLNDICVMKVSPAIVLENGTAVVALAENTTDPIDGSNSTVVGWGRLAAWGEIPNDLRKAVLPIVDREKCRKDWQEDESIYATQVCAGGRGDKDACNGDSGGPLFVNDKQVGIVSWGRPCAFKGYPTVFTKVSEYISWISKHTQD